MGFQIRVVQGAGVKVGAQDLSIQADQIREVQTVQVEKPSFKEGNEVWLKRFIAETELGDFTWDVTFLIDLSGAELEGFVLVSAPKDAEILSGPRFEKLEVEGD